MARQGQGKVVRTNVTQPFCVKRHIGLHLNASIGMDVTSFSLIFEQPLLQMAIENGFQLSILWPHHPLVTERGGACVIILGKKKASPTLPLG